MLLAICSYVSLLTLNVLFGIGGIAIFAVGCIYQAKTLNIYEGMPVEYQSLGHLPLFAILFGLMLMLVASTGCWGAIKKNRFLLIIYSVLLSLFLICQLVLGSYVTILLQDFVRSQAAKALRQDFDDYYFSETKNFIDEIQRHLECCGPDGPCYWGANIPESCFLPNSSSVYKRGCIYPHVNGMMKPFDTMGIIILGMGCVEALGIISAICLLWSTKNGSGKHGLFNRPSSSSF